MPTPEAVKLGMDKIKKAEELLRKTDDFATTLLGMTSEAVDLLNTGHGLLAGTLLIGKDGLVEEADV